MLEHSYINTDQKIDQKPFRKNVVRTNGLAPSKCIREMNSAPFSVSPKCVGFHCVGKYHTDLIKTDFHYFSLPQFHGTNTLAYSPPASAADIKCFVPLPPDWPESEAEGVQQIPDSAARVSLFQTLHSGNRTTKLFTVVIHYFTVIG